MSWTIYRHKEKPNIRYWVEEAPPGTGLYLKPYRDGEDTECVRIKGVRNVRFDTEDRPFTLASEAGLWPMEKFLELYEPEEAA